MALPSHGQIWEMDAKEGGARRARVEGLSDGLMIRLHFLGEGEPITIERTALVAPGSVWRLVPEAPAKPQ